MSFFESIKTVFRKYAEFGGRATRPEFWWWVLFTSLVSAMLSTLSFGVADPRMFEVSASATSIGGYVSFTGAWSIAVLLPSLAVTVRRLRDAGRNWTEIFWILLPIAGAIILIVRLAEPSATDAVATPPAPPAPPAPPTQG
ncbi:MAG: DUF805 domain-containing protein [Salinibacterium sp.]|nr:DUF805 domain-containing protein [Salinibacterium sp.]